MHIFASYFSYLLKINNNFFYHIHLEVCNCRHNLFFELIFVSLYNTNHYQAKNKRLNLNDMNKHFLYIHLYLLLFFLHCKNKAYIYQEKSDNKGLNHLIKNYTSNMNKGNCFVMCFGLFLHTCNIKDHKYYIYYLNHNRNKIQEDKNNNH